MSLVENNTNLVPIVENVDQQLPATIDDSLPVPVDTKDDIDYIRKKLRELVDGGQEAFDSAVNLATEAESPNAIRAVAEVMRATVEALDKLSDVHVKRVDIQHPKGRRAAVAQPVATNQQLAVDNSVVYVGTPAQLLDKIKNQGPILLNEDN